MLEHLAAQLAAPADRAGRRAARLPSTACRRGSSTAPGDRRSTARDWQARRTTQRLGARAATTSPSRGRTARRCWPRPRGGSAGSTSASSTVRPPTAPSTSSASTPGRAVRGVAVRAPLLQGPAGDRRGLAAASPARTRRDTECVEHGALLLREAELAHGGGRLDEAHRARPSGRWRSAGASARADLEAEALQTIGRVLIDAGRPTEGMAHLDEAMLLAVEGRLGPVLDGQGVLQPHQRVRGARRPAPGGGVDRGNLALGGAASVRDLPRDLPRPPGGGARPAGRAGRRRAEASQACTELLASHVPNAAAAYAEVGDIRRRLGDLDGAEEAFARAEELCGRHVRRPRVLRLAQGRVDEAARIIARCLARQSRTGWPGRGCCRPPRRSRSPPATSTAPRRSVGRARGDRRRVRHAVLRAWHADPRATAAGQRRSTAACARCARRCALAGARRSLRGGHHPHPVGGAPRRRRRESARHRSPRPGRCSTRSAPASTRVRRLTGRRVAAGRADGTRGRGAATRRRGAHEQGDRRRRCSSARRRCPGTSRTSSPRSACRRGSAATAFAFEHNIAGQ